MKTNYLLLLCAIFLMSCNNQSTTEKSVSATTSKKTKKVSPESVFTNEQISNLEYQVEAFKIGSEKVVNAELKKYWGLRFVITLYLYLLGDGYFMTPLQILCIY